MGFGYGVTDLWAVITAQPQSTGDKPEKHTVDATVRALSPARGGAWHAPPMLSWFSARAMAPWALRVSAGTVEDSLGFATRAMIFGTRGMDLARPRPRIQCDRYYRLIARDKDARLMAAARSRERIGGIIQQLGMER